MKKIIMALLLATNLQVTSSDNAQSKPQGIPIYKTIFVNGRVNPVQLIITDSKNKDSYLSVGAGREHAFTHQSQQLKKVICSEKLAPKVTLSQTDLNTYAAFVFNIARLEKYHFISEQQKVAALKHARDTKNKSLFDEISEKTIYNP